MLRKIKHSFLNSQSEFSQLLPRTQQRIAPAAQVISSDPHTIINPHGVCVTPDLIQLGTTLQGRSFLLGFVRSVVIQVSISAWPASTEVDLKHSLDAHQPLLRVCYLRRTPKCCTAPSPTFFVPASLLRMWALWGSSILFVRQPELDMT